MLPWNRVRSWIRTSLQRSRMESDMDAELRFHLEAYTDELIRQGVPPDEAKRRARLEFGGMDRAKEECREATGVDIIGSFLQDLRYGARMLRSYPGFTAVAVLSLALGIGANSTVFSIVDNLYLKPWPVKHPERLVAIQTDGPKEPGFRMSSLADYREIAGQATAFSDVVAFGDRGGFVSRAGEGREVGVEVVSDNYFTALGVNALKGRTFSPRPAQANAESRSVVISYRLWQRYFGGDPALPGKTALLDGKQFTVIGIAPRGFFGLRREGGPDVWVTTGGWATMVPGEERYYPDHGSRWFELSGRLRDGQPVAAARAQLRTLAKRLALAYPATNQGTRFLLSEYGVGGDEGRWAVYLMAMVGLVLLISCVNVANLLLAQMERRQREIAMRRALGAGQTRLVRQLLTEGLLLALAGGGLGVLLIAGLMRIVPALVPMLSTTDLQLDTRVMLFTGAVSLLMTFVFGLAPAVRASRGDVVPVLKGEDPRAGRDPGRVPLRSLLVAGEIAFSVVLLAGSALLLRSLLYSQGIRPGFNPEKNVLMMPVAPASFYGYTPSQEMAIYPALAAHLETVPGVVRATYARRPPLTDIEGGETKSVAVPGVQPPAGSDGFKIRYNVVAPKYFATLGTRLVAGREFNQFDLPTSEPVVVINQAMARQFWPGQDALGRSVKLDGKDHRIVGVVESGRYVALHEEAQPYLFVAFPQEFSFECILLVETAGDAQAMTNAVLRETASTGRLLPMLGATTMQEYMHSVMETERSMVALLGTLSVIGMLLASAGLYAAVAYMVSRRTHEIGVRMALGASKRKVLALVLAQGVRLSLAGAAVGLVGAFAMSHLIAGFLYGVAPTDALSYAAGALAAIAVALVASYVPARRAMRVDPMIALRYE